MAFLKPAKEEAEIRKTPVSQLRKDYVKLAEDYNKMLDGHLLFCHRCNSYKSHTGFYHHKEYSSGFFPLCKECLLELVEQRNSKRDKPNETKESVQSVFRMMNLPYIDSLYEKACKSVSDSSGERVKTSPFTVTLTQIASLPQWRGKTWRDSEFEIGSDEVITNRKPKRETMKRFGGGFSNEEYLYLQDQYEDWCSRTQVDSKSQETYIIRICFKLLDIWKAQREGKDTTKLDESLNKLMDAAKLQPKQNVGNAATDSLSFGELIQRWELNAPIPEPDPELSDVSNIGKNLRVWFGGWLANALGLDIPITQEFQDEVAKYTVEKPSGNSDNVSSTVYTELFGNEGETDGG